MSAWRRSNRRDMAPLHGMFRGPITAASFELRPGCVQPKRTMIGSGAFFVNYRSCTAAPPLEVATIF